MGDINAEVGMSNTGFKNIMRRHELDWLYLLPILLWVSLSCCCHVLFTPITSASDFQCIVFFGLPTFLFWLENFKLGLYSWYNLMVFTHLLSSPAIIYTLEQLYVSNEKNITNYMLSTRLLISTSLSVVFYLAPIRSFDDWINDCYWTIHLRYIRI